MHLLQARTYAGEPGETVTVDTEVEGGGHATVVIDGVEVEADPRFTLKATPGDETHMRIALFGAVGESCVVKISEVDGGSDGDLLLCQTLDPAPIHLYRFIVASAAAVRSLSRSAPVRGRAAARRGTRKPRARRGR
jgi:hypothetical protein